MVKGNLRRSNRSTARTGWPEYAISINCTMTALFLNNNDLQLTLKWKGPFNVNIFDMSKDEVQWPGVDSRVLRLGTEPPMLV